MVITSWTIFHSFVSITIIYLGPVHLNKAIRENFRPDDRHSLILLFRPVPDDGRCKSIENGRSYS